MPLLNICDCLENKLANLYPQEWLENSVSVAKLCTFDLSELSYQYPAEILPAKYTPSEYLRVLVEQGIQKRFLNGVSDSIRATIEKELKLIHEQAYEYFFLTDKGNSKNSFILLNQRFIICWSISDKQFVNTAKPTLV